MVKRAVVYKALQFVGLSEAYVYLLHPNKESYINRRTINKIEYIIRSYDFYNI